MERGQSSTEGECRRDENGIVDRVPPWSGLLRYIRTWRLNGPSRVWPSTPFALSLGHAENGFTSVDRVYVTMHIRGEG